MPILRPHAARTR